MEFVTRARQRTTWSNGNGDTRRDLFYWCCYEFDDPREKCLVDEFVWHSVRSEQFFFSFSRFTSKRDVSKNFDFSIMFLNISVNATVLLILKSRISVLFASVYARTSANSPFSYIWGRQADRSHTFINFTFGFGKTERKLYSSVIQNESTFNTFLYVYYDNS